MKETSIRCAAVSIALSLRRRSFKKMHRSVISPVITDAHHTADEAALKLLFTSVIIRRFSVLGIRRCNFVVTAPLASLVTASAQPSFTYAFLDQRWWELQIRYIWMHLKVEALVSLEGEDEGSRWVAIASNSLKPWRYAVHHHHHHHLYLFR